jgi:hypothetical protein
MNWYGIKTLQALGLVWDVKLPKLGSARIQPVVKPEIKPAEVEAVAVAYSGD